MASTISRPSRLIQIVVKFMCILSHSLEFNNFYTGMACRSRVRQNIPTRGVQTRSETNPNPIGLFRISDQVRSFRIGSDKVVLESDRIGLEPDFQLLELEKESSSVKVDTSGLVFWSS